MKTKLRSSLILALLATAFLSAITASAQNKITKPTIELGAPFTHNAILQREMPIPVWGWSPPGTKVTVKFSDQKQQATANKDGKWTLSLKPLKASAEPRKMSITDSAGNTRTLENILVGEVWLASGQSNMQWNVAKCDVGRVLLAQINKRVKEGTETTPIIREALITNYFAHLHPIEHAEAVWSDAGGKSSAIAFAFAYELYKELNVPIGILNCSFSQTSIQAWTPRCGFEGASDEYTKAIYQKTLQSDPSTPEHKAAWNKFYQDIEDTIQHNKEQVKNGKPAKSIPNNVPGNLASNRDASWLFNARLNPMIPFAIRGAIWNQGYANSGEGIFYYNNLHSLIRGWRKLWNKPELPVYFHQFYCPGQKKEAYQLPSISRTAEMRLGTWLARDIPHTGMASQIDITGSIHYRNKTLPAQRLALHALKNQYKKAITADGPMFKSYEVKANKLIVTLDNADTGIVIAETGTNSRTGLAIPTIIPNGEKQVKLFYIADENRIWHPANLKIDGNKVILSSPNVKSPRGVSYATAGVGNQPNIYNKALLPTTPFIYFDNKLVTSKTWPTETLKVANQIIDPKSIGKVYEYRKMPLLSTQFRENAVLQANQPLTIWGSAVHDWGYEADGKALIKFSFAGINKTIPVTPGMKEWKVTLPPMKPSADPKTLKVSFEIDGKLIHQRICKNIVLGDVYFIAAPKNPLGFRSKTKSKNIVRMIVNKSKRFSKNHPSRFTVAVSSTPLNRFAAVWTEASGLAAQIAHSIGSKTGNPVGIIFMQSKHAKNPTTLKSWIKASDLHLAPSLSQDYKNIAASFPGNQYYDQNAHNYITLWKKYWAEYIPKMIATKSVPDSASWGSYPILTSSVTTKAAEVYNVLVHSFTPTTLKGIIFLPGASMVEKDQGEHFSSEITTLINTWKKKFSNTDTPFYFTIPNKTMAPKITAPSKITGKHAHTVMSDWNNTLDLQKLIEIISKDALK